MTIHPSAVVDPTAELGDDVIVHPFTVIEPGVRIGDGCEIGPHAVIRTGTRMGSENTVTIGVVLGDTPQDLKYEGEETYLDIGDRNLIREYATLHRATGEGKSTRVGSECLIMAYCHLGHNVSVGDRVMIANCTQLGGHVAVEDCAILGGLTGIHQYTRIGTMSMIGAWSGVRIDVPPYMLANGNPARPRKLNTVGLRRNGVSAESIGALQAAYRVLYRSGLNTTDAVARVRDEIDGLPEILHLVEFLEKIPEGERGRQLD